MSESKGKINPQASFSTTINLDKEVWKSFRTEVIKREMKVSEGIEEAFAMWLSGKSSTTTGTKVPSIPTDGTGTDAGLAKTRESPRMESPRQFLERLSVLLESVPQGSVPVVEECLLQIVQLATGPFTGVKTDEQRAPNKPKTFRRIKDLRDNPEDVEDLSGKSA